MSWWFFALWEIIFSLFLSLARDALVALLREHGKGEQAEMALRGELMELIFHYCKIGDDGVEIVADFLKHDETVRVVNLAVCSIGLHGVNVIAESLKHNQTVEIANFEWNQIGDEGAGALMEALNYNVCTKKLIIYTYSIAPKLWAIIQYLTKTLNKILVPAAVRRASLCLIAARNNIADAGTLATFPKEIVKMIAMEVYGTRNEPIWLNALSESERTGESGD